MDALLAGGVGHDLDGIGVDQCGGHKEAVDRLLGDQLAQPLDPTEHGKGVPCLSGAMRLDVPQGQEP